MPRISNLYTTHKSLIYSLLFLVVYSTTVVLAAPPTTPYYPTDNITDPTCSPTDTNCYVSVFPDQTSNTGKLLFTDGTNPVWSDNLTWRSADNQLRIESLGASQTQPLILVRDDAGNEMFRISGDDWIHPTEEVNNLFFGKEAGMSNTVTGVGLEGTFMTAIGSRSLRANTTGYSNTGIGIRTLEANTTGSVNTAVGIAALVTNTTGHSNVAVGQSALHFNTAGYTNVAFGRNALFSITGNENVGIGGWTAFSNTLGSSNVFLGYSAGYSTTGSGHVLLGYQAGRNAVGDSKLYIENSSSQTPLIYGDFASNWVGINTLNTNVASTLHVTGAGATSSTYTARFHNSTGTSNSLVIRDDGWVSIGASTPGISSNELTISKNNLFLSGASAATAIWIYSSNDSATSSLDFGANSRKWSFTKSTGATPDFLLRSDNNNTTVTIYDYYGRQQHLATRTATANNDYGWNFTGTLTSRTTASDTMYGALFNPTMNAGSTNQTLYAMYINPTFGATNSPSAYQLGIEGTGGAIVRLNRTTASASGGVSLGQINYYNGSTRSAILDGVGDGAVDSGRLDFWTKATGGSLTQSMIIFSTGNVGIGITSSSTSRLHVKSNSTTSNAALLVEDSAAAPLFKVNNNGVINIGAASTFFSLASSGGSSVDKAGLGFLFASSSFNTTVGFSNNFYFGSFNAVSGAQGLFRTTGTAQFNPTSGSATFTLFDFSNIIINQTGGANGITRGLYINPTLTAAADFRAIETTAGKVIFNSNLASSYNTSMIHDGNDDNRWGLLIQTGTDLPVANKWIQFNDGDGTDQGSICFTGGQANICAPSDSRLKQNIQDTSLSLATLNSIQVKDFSYISDTNNNTIHGFIAQELYEVYPSAVSVPQDPNEHWKVSYNQLTPLIVKAIQEVDIKVQDLSNISTDTPETLGSLIKSFLANASNSIEELYAMIVKSDRVETRELCVGSVCVTESQFLQMLENSGQSSSGSSVVEESSVSDVTSSDTPLEVVEEEPTLEDILPASAQEDSGETMPASAGSSGETMEEMPIVESSV